MPNTNKPKPTESQPFGNTTRSLSLLLCLGALAGVLIWAKLRLVTDIPRSAYADPRERDQGADDRNDGDSEEADSAPEQLGEGASVRDRAPEFEP